MKREQEQRNDASIQHTKSSTSKTFALCPHCQRTNHPPEKCWSGLNTASRPKRFKQEYPADRRNDGQQQGNLNHAGRTFINSQKPLKLKKPQLHWADYTSVRQYVISDPPTIVYHSHQSLNTGIPSAVWHQQMEKAYIRRYENMHMINNAHTSKTT